MQIQIGSAGFLQRHLQTVARAYSISAALDGLESAHLSAFWEMRFKGKPHSRRMRKTFTNALLVHCIDQKHGTINLK